MWSNLIKHFRSSSQLRRLSDSSSEFLLAEKHVAVYPLIALTSSVVIFAAAKSIYYLACNPDATFFKATRKAIMRGSQGDL